MRYVLGESGALIYDLRQGMAVHRQSFDPELVETVWQRMACRDLMPQLLMQDAPVMAQRDVDHLERFHMSHYRSHFLETGRLVEDAWTQGAEKGWCGVDKICLYHTSPEERALSREALRDLPITLADAEETSLELSPLGVDKGKGLGILCRHLGIPMEETIAVGDSYNDLSVLRTAGLAVAMGNAVPAVRSSCGAVVADNDHCGVAEAVDRFLLR
jgi:hydroxymethylpyrimidine pyrophosphatase-like HAD family hydrolase